MELLGLAGWIPLRKGIARQLNVQVVRVVRSVEFQSVAPDDVAFIPDFGWRRLNGRGFWHTAIQSRLAALASLQLDLTGV